MRRRVLVGLVPLLGFALVTLLALEAGGVAVLRTERPDHSVRETHVWWVEHEGALWVEAATPERAWLAEALAAGVVDVERDGVREHMRVERASGADAHARVRALLREKYGLRDWWVGRLQDTSRSLAVLLRPGESEPGSRP